MKNYSEALKNCQLFYNIEYENISGMLACLQATTKTYKKNEIILDEGTPTKHIGIVVYGNARLERTDYFGNRSVVAIAEPGEMFAESFACTGAKLPMDIVAETPCEIMYIDCKKIIHTCGNSCDFHNSMIYNLVKILSNKNIALNQKAQITSKRTTREKLMTFLEIQAKKHGSNTFTILYDRQTLADFLEVDRSGLSAEISKLRAEGVIENKKSTFKLL